MKRIKSDNISSQIVDVLVNQDNRLESLRFGQEEADKLIWWDEEKDADDVIADTDVFLAKRGIVIEDDDEDDIPEQTTDIILAPAWGDMVLKAREAIGEGHSLDELFTEAELAEQDLELKRINDDFKSIHRLDKYDIGISALAGIVAAAIDILLVGIPERTPDGLKAAPLGDYIRDAFNKKFPEEEMAKLANLPEAKVPYDAPFNPGYTNEHVEGLSTYYHRLLSLGHDPLLGLFVGTHDILTGKMTTIDKTGRVVSQVIDRYSDRKEQQIFDALAKQILHFKTDVTTTMGLPAPAMALFNLMQFGKIGEEELTVAEIVQGMYYEGYDFIHFCGQSMPVIIAELIVRLGYAGKRINEGHSIKDSIPFSTNHAKNPKLASMLFIAHSAAAAINAGNVYFRKNPMAINYPQWVAFSAYAFKQAKWSFIDKPEARHAYVNETLDRELAEVIELSLGPGKGTEIVFS